MDILNNTPFAKPLAAVPPHEDAKKQEPLPGVQAGVTDGEQIPATSRMLSTAKAPIRWVGWARSLALTHDHYPALDAGYLVATFLIAAMLNLGAFAVLIALHMWLDVLKYYELHGFRIHRALAAALRESLVDVALLCVGMFFGMYFHDATLVAPVSGIIRAEATIVRGLMLLTSRITIFHRITHTAARLRHHLHKLRPHPLRPWSMGEHLTMAFIAVLVIAILTAPYFLYISWDLWLSILGHEMLPWRI